MILQNIHKTTFLDTKSIVIYILAAFPGWWKMNQQIAMQYFLELQHFSEPQCSGVKTWGILRMSPYTFCV